MSDVVISCSGLGKRYTLGEQERYRALRDVITDAAAAPFRRVRSAFNGNSIRNPKSDIRNSIWALDDVSFEINQGEAVGIIGRNGAGKSTLLKILSRITKPTRGHVEIHGRVGSLLEVGTGFHPELTGRENIYLNGAILGMRKAEINRKFDEIVAFSEVEKFIDTPVKRYSSGMYVRLAFAVAAHMETEILVIDEVLAVGDVAFQRKCLGKMGDVAHSGRTVLFVSHNMQAVRTLCQKAVWLDRGRVVEVGPSAVVVENYLSQSSSTDTLENLAQQIEQLPADPNFRLNRVLLVQDELPTTTVLSGKPLDLIVEFSVLRESAGLHIYVQLLDREGTLLLETINNGDSTELPIVPVGDYVSRLTFPAELFAERSYELNIKAGIHCVRELLPQPIRVQFDVEASGKVNQAYSGYRTLAKLAPLFEWQTKQLASESTLEPVTTFQ
jgi:lipopolysaccharide transport system ATP-binding protein